MKKIFTLFVLSFVFSLFYIVQAQSLEFSPSTIADAAGKGTLTSGINQNVHIDKVNIYAYDGAIYIVANNQMNMNGKVMVCSITGKLVEGYDLNNNTYNRIDFNQKGIYIVKVYANGDSYTKKLYIR